MAQPQGAVGGQNVNYTGVTAGAVTGYTKSKYPILSRYHGGQHPLAKEASLGKLEPLPETRAAFVKALTREMVGNGQGALDPYTVKKYQDKMVLEGMGENVDIMYAREFQRWIRGVSVFNEPSLTPWGHRNMFHVPGAVEYLRELIQLRFDYQQSLMHLYMQPPQTLLDLELYYKYIVLQFGLVIPRGDGMAHNTEMPDGNDPRSFMSISGMLYFLDDYQLTSFIDRDLPLTSDALVTAGDADVNQDSVLLDADRATLAAVAGGEGPMALMPNGVPGQGVVNAPQPMPANITQALQLQLERQHLALIAKLSEVSRKHKEDVEASSRDAQTRHAEHGRHLLVVEQNAAQRQADIIAKMQELIDSGGSTPDVEELRKNLAAAKSAAAAETARLEQEYTKRESAAKLAEAKQATKRAKAEAKMKQELERVYTANTAFAANQNQLREMLRAETERAQQAHDLALAATKGATAEQVRLLNENMKLKTDLLYKDVNKLSEAVKEQVRLRDAEIQRLGEELAKVMAEANASGENSAQGQWSRDAMSQYLTLLNEQLRQQQYDIDAGIAAAEQWEADEQAAEEIPKQEKAKKKKREPDYMDLTIPEAAIPAGAQQFIDQNTQAFVKLEEATVSRTIQLKPEPVKKEEPKTEPEDLVPLVFTRFNEYARANGLTDTDLHLFDALNFPAASMEDQWSVLNWLNEQTIEDPELHDYKVEKAANLAISAVNDAISRIMDHEMSDSHAREGITWLLTEALEALDDRYFTENPENSRRYYWGALNNVRRFLMGWFGLPEAASFPIDKYVDDLPLDENGNVDKTAIFDAMDESIVLAGAYARGQEIIEDEASNRGQSSVHFVAETLKYLTQQAAIDVDVYPALAMDVDASTENDHKFVLTTTSSRRNAVIDLTGAAALIPPSNVSSDEAVMLNSLVSNAIKQEITRYVPGREHPLDASPESSLAHVHTSQMIDVGPSYMNAVMQTMKESLDNNVDPITALTFAAQHISRQMHQHEAYAMSLMGHLEQFNQVPNEDQYAELRRFGSILAAAQATNGIALGTVGGYVEELRLNNDTNPEFHYDQHVLAAADRVLRTAENNVTNVRTLLTRVKQHMLRRYLGDGLDQHRYGPNDHLQAAMVMLLPDASVAVEELTNPANEPPPISPEDAPAEAVSDERFEQFQAEVVKNPKANEELGASKSAATLATSGELQSYMQRLAMAVAAGLPAPPRGTVKDMLAMINKTPTKTPVRNAALSEVAQLERFTKRVNLGHLATLRKALIDVDAKRAPDIRPKALKSAIDSVTRAVKATVANGTLMRASFDNALMRLNEIYGVR